MAEARWKVKPKGFATVRKDGWYVRPQAKAPAPRTTPGNTQTPGPGAPRGGTVSSTTRTQAVNRLVPREYAGSAGVIGGWAKEPRLNPDQYEWTQNEAGRWFARPRTETTGLDPQQKADISGFDLQTKAQQDRINEVYSNYATQAGQDRDAAAAAFGQMGALSGAGYTAPTFGQAAGPYGSVSAPAVSQATQALPGVLGQSATQGSTAVSAQNLFQLSQLPTLGRSLGATANESYTVQRQKDRADLLSGYRGQAADAAAAQQEAAATLRGQNLDLLAKQLSSKTDLAKANLSSRTTLTTAGIRAKTAAQDRAAKLATDAAKLRQQATIARERNLTSRANTLDRLAASKEKEADKAKKKAGPTQADRRSWAKAARDMYEGIPRTVTEDYTDPTTGEKKKRQVTQYLQYSSTEIIKQLMAMGATRAQATKEARLVFGSQYAGTPVSPTTSSTLSGLFRF